MAALQLLPLTRGSEGALGAIDGRLAAGPEGVVPAAGQRAELHRAGWGWGWVGGVGVGSAGTLGTRSGDARVQRTQQCLAMRPETTGPDVPAPPYLAVRHAAAGRLVAVEAEEGDQGGGKLQSRGWAEGG